jgi:hypothetical protein
MKMDSEQKKQVMKFIEAAFENDVYWEISISQGVVDLPPSSRDFHQYMRHVPDGTHTMTFTWRDKPKPTL